MPNNRQTQLKCPECKHGDGLRKIEDFYRCSGCGHEWFDDEIIKVPYKTASFVNEEGRTVYIAQTPERIERLKDKGAYKNLAKSKKRHPNGRFQPSGGISRKDKNLLRRLRK